MGRVPLPPACKIGINVVPHTNTLTFHVGRFTPGIEVTDVFVWDQFTDTIDYVRILPSFIIIERKLVDRIDISKLELVSDRNKK